MTHNISKDDIPKLYIGGYPFSKDQVVVTYKDHLKWLQKAHTEKFVDGMIAATQWLIDNGHLKAGKELNEMMLKALVNHSELDQDKK